MGGGGGLGLSSVRVCQILLSPRQTSQDAVQITKAMAVNALDNVAGNVCVTILVGPDWPSKH